MKSRNVLTSLVVASLGLASMPSFAQTPRQDAHEARQDLREARRDLRDARQERRYRNAHEFRRGGPLPPELRERHYVATDWRAIDSLRRRGAAIGCKSGPTTCWRRSPPA